MRKFVNGWPVVAERASHSIMRSADARIIWLAPLPRRVGAWKTIGTHPAADRTTVLPVPPRSGRTGRPVHCGVSWKPQLRNAIQTWWQEK